VLKKLKNENQEGIKDKNQDRKENKINLKNEDQSKTIIIFIIHRSEPTTAVAQHRTDTRMFVSII
jgi:hypothetical protein